MVEERFKRYEYVDTGIFVIHLDESSEVVFCNHEFADLIDLTPDHIVGRSLDEFIKSRSLIYDRAKDFIDHQNQIAISGGLNLRFHILEAPYTLVLKLFKVSIKRRGKATYLVGYLRELTAIEGFLERTHLNTNVDFLWKPVTTFLLSGSWRPYVTLLAPIWLPYVSYHVPDIADFLSTMLHL